MHLEALGQEVCIGLIVGRISQGEHAARALGKDQCPWRGRESWTVGSGIKALDVIPDFAASLGLPQLEQGAGFDLTNAFP